MSFCSQVPGRHWKVWVGDEDGAKSRLLHQPGQGEDLLLSGQGKSFCDAVREVKRLDWTGVLNPAQTQHVSFFQLRSASEAIDVCSEAHQRDPRNTNVLRDRAEAYILNQDYEKGEGATPIGESKHAACFVIGHCLSGPSFHGAKWSQRSYHSLLF